LNTSRTEKLALILFLLVSLLTIAFVINGLQKSELVLELRRNTYCFQGYVKYLFCISVLVFLPSLLYTVYLGKKIQGNRNTKMVIGKVKNVILAGLFFTPLITIPVSFVIANFSCG
jgi:hypothetical protein